MKRTNTYIIFILVLLNALILFSWFRPSESFQVAGGATPSFTVVDSFPYQGVIYNFTKSPKDALEGYNLDSTMIIDTSTNKEVWNNLSFSNSELPSSTGTYAIISYFPRETDIYDSLPCPPSFLTQNITLADPSHIVLINSTTYRDALPSNAIIINGMLMKGPQFDRTYTAQDEIRILRDLIIFTNNDPIIVDIYESSNPTVKLNKENLILRKDKNYIFAYNGFYTVTLKTAADIFVGDRPIFRKPDGTYVDVRNTVTSTTPTSFIPYSKQSAERAAAAALEAKTAAVAAATSAGETAKAAEVAAAIAAEKAAGEAAKAAAIAAKDVTNTAAQEAANAAKKKAEDAAAAAVEAEKDAKKKLEDEQNKTLWVGAGLGTAVVAVAGIGLWAYNSKS